MSIMQINGEDKQGLDFLADLWSGRLHRTIAALTKTLKRQAEALGTLFEENIEMTANQQKIEDAATLIGTEMDIIVPAIQALDDKITALENQGVPTEDLSAQLSDLNASVARIKALGDTLTPAPAEPAPPVTAPVDSQVPSNPALVSPLDPEPPGATVGQPVQGTPFQVPTPEPQTPADPTLDDSPANPAPDSDNTVDEGPGSGAVAPTGGAIDQPVSQVPVETDVPQAVETQTPTSGEIAPDLS